MNDTLVIELPIVPDRNRADAHWWRAADGAVVESGVGEEWTRMLASEEGQRRLVALAPASAVRVAFPDPSQPAATERQAEAIARVAAIETSLGEPETLHAVGSSTGDAMRPIMTAVVDNGVMLGWVDWLGAFGADAHHIVPVGSLLPSSDQWLTAQFGSEAVIGRGGLVMPFEPALTDAVVDGAEVTSLGRERTEAILAEAAAAPPIDLRVGQFARRKRLLIDRDRVRTLSLMAAAIPLIALIWALVVLIKLTGATDRLNEETMRLVETTLGRPANLENAEAELRGRVGGTGYGGFRPLVAALYNGLQADPGVAATELSYRTDGTLAASLAAPTVDPINRLLIALQRSGYRVTAVPRQSPDGRSIVDVTIRSGP